MKRKPKPIYNEVQYDSKEEVEFAMWLEEAIELKLVKEASYHSYHFYYNSVKELSRIEWRYEPPDFNKKKFKPTSYLRRKQVTPDWMLLLNGELWYSLFGNLILPPQTSEYEHSFIDVKGKKILRTGSKFFVEQVLVWHTAKAMIFKVIPENFFKKTWVPMEVRKDKRYAGTLNKVRKAYIGVPTKHDIQLAIEKYT